jgi:hypothetical protein
MLNHVQETVDIKIPGNPIFENHLTMLMEYADAVLQHCVSANIEIHER